MRVLVTGAAGFIGSTTAEVLLDEGHEVVALDDLSTGHRENVPTRANFVEGRCGDAALVASLGPFDACLHFAGRIEPAISMSAPELFFEVNVAQSLALLRTLVETGCPKVVFSSSAAVYGTQHAMPITEDRPIGPESPYGESKAQVETALRWLVARGRLRAASLRYFNAAGATPAHPEHHDPEIHLIPLALDAAAGVRDGLDLYGEDYPTRDGTCVRDYVHVLDLAAAHALAIAALDEHTEIVANLGCGVGYSNLQVIEAVRRVTGRTFEVRRAPRRPGDPPSAVASNARAREILGWEPRHSSLEEIVTDAWHARRAH